MNKNSHNYKYIYIKQIYIFNTNIEIENFGGSVLFNV